MSTSVIEQSRCHDFSEKVKRSGLRARDSAALAGAQQTKKWKTFAGIVKLVRSLIVVELSYMAESIDTAQLMTILLATEEFCNAARRALPGFVAVFHVTQQMK